MKNRIIEIIDESKVLHARLEILIPQVERAGEIMCQALSAGNKIMFVGNGGSAADAQHLAAELVNRFRKERRPLAGLALTTDTSVLTSIGNDYSFDDVYAKQVMALGKPGDVLMGISTSGNSRNIIKAFDTARKAGIMTVSLTGQKGELIAKANCAITVPSDITPRIQEVHILIGHILCELMENNLCSD